MSIESQLDALALVRTVNDSPDDFSMIVNLSSHEELKSIVVDLAGFANVAIEELLGKISALVKNTFSANPGIAVSLPIPDVNDYLDSVVAEVVDAAA